MTTIHDSPDLFAEWLLSRRIIPRKGKSDSCFDSKLFVNNGSTPQGLDTYTSRYWRDGRPMRNEFPQGITSTIDAYLNELQTLSIRNPTKTEFGEPFVHHIKECKDDTEPVWSSSRIQDPATLLLPSMEKLYINDSLNDIKKAPYELRENLNIHAKNNLMCIYGKWLFMAVDRRIEIHNIDLLLDRESRYPVYPILDTFYWYKENAYTLFAKFGVDYTQRERSDFSINVIKVAKYMYRDVLCACLDNGIVLLLDIEALFKSYKLKLNTHDYVRNNYIMIPTNSVTVLKVPDSCWSIDIIDTPTVSYIATGHNKPGVSIFAVKSENNNDNEMTFFKSFDIYCMHNIPSLNFISESVDKKGYVTLAFCSIYGSTTTVKVKLQDTNNELDVKLLDLQFFGDYCWSITPLHKKDFVKVFEFEFLNMNYQTNFKKSILYSACKDSMIFNCRPPSAYCSGELGIGALTTQIPVPVANLSLRCVNWIKEEGNEVELRFTSFNSDSSISKARLKAKESHPLTSQNNNESFYNRVTPVISGDRLNISNTEDVIQHYYAFQDPGSKHDCFTDEYNKRFGQWWNDPTVLTGSSRKSSTNKNYQFEQGDEITFTNRFQSLNINTLKDSPFSMLDHSMKHHCGTDGTAIYAYSSSYVIDKTSCDWNQLKRYVESDHDIDLEESTPDISFTGNTEAISNDEETLEKKDYASQKGWQIHNHASKVRELMNMIEVGSESSLTGYKLKELDEYFLLITTISHIFLVKAHPLIITSFTKDEVFPIDDVSLCTGYSLLKSINSIKFVCHIKELNAIAVASPIGIISLLRLTEYNGIYSFRQEYILGWVPQDPEDLSENNHCFRVTYFRDNIVDSWYCGVDDVHFPYFNILGMDYNYIPGDEVNGIHPYAILYVNYPDTIRRIKIMAGSRS